MPHDRKGNELKAGDRVLIPVHPVRTFQVQPNPDHPEEYTPQLQVQTGDETLQIERTVVTVYEGETACNMTVEVAGGFQATFNTRLVEKVGS